MLPISSFSVSIAGMRPSRCSTDAFERRRRANHCTCPGNSAVLLELTYPQRPRLANCVDAALGGAGLCHLDTPTRGQLMPEPVSLLMLEFLIWVANHRRTYADAMEVWR